MGAYTDDTRKLLELAALAAGIGGTGCEFAGGILLGFRKADRTWFSPHTDDGDSARLRTVLGIFVAWPKRGRVYLYFTDENGLIVLAVSEMFSDHSGDKNAALRWATLRLAAEIGRRMICDVTFSR